MNNTSPASDEIKRNIRAFVVDTFLFDADNGLTETTSFLGQGILDSTGVLELVTHLEETYGIKVKDDELTPDNLDSITAIAAFVQNKRQNPTG